MSQDLELTQRQKFRLTQQQINVGRLLELNAPEFDELVERELDTNPALEAVEGTLDAPAERLPEGESGPDVSSDSAYWYGAAPQRSSRGSGSEAPSFTPADNSESLYDFLNAQINERPLSPEIAAMAHYIVGNLDSNGYLRRPLDRMLDDLAVNTGHDVPREIAKMAYDVVRELDPPGIGAENLRDCLLLQIRRLPDSEARSDAQKILEDFFDAYSSRHSVKILSGAHMNKERLDAADRLIRTLNPRPGGSFGGNAETAAGVIVPDFDVSYTGDTLYITLNNRIPELAISESFAEATRGLERRRGRPRKGTEYVLARYNEAREFIGNIRMRQRTMMEVMTAIVDFQRRYFESGDVHKMRPMMLEDLSRLTGLHPSVISRATNNKYVSMPWGEIMGLRHFFSGTVNAESEAAAGTDASGEGSSDSERGEDALTNRKIEELITRLVEGEDKLHPLSDEKLRKEIEKMGYEVSRRTVAKYRDRLGILVARLRKDL